MRKQITVIVCVGVLAAVSLTAWRIHSQRHNPSPTTSNADASPAAPRQNPSQQTGNALHTNDAELIRKKDAANDPKDRQIALATLYSRLEREGKLAEYAHTLEKSLRGDQRDRNALEELSILYQSPALKDSQKEYQFLKRFVEYDKTNPSALMRLSQYEAQRTNTTATYELAAEAARIHPERATAHRLDGAIFLDNAGDADRSAQICQQIIADPKADGRGLLYAGDQLFKLGRVDQALQAYNLTVQRAEQDNLRQRAQVAVYRIRAQTEGIDAVRPSLEILVTNGVTPLIQQQARNVLTNQTLRTL